MFCMNNILPFNAKSGYMPIYFRMEFGLHITTLPDSQLVPNELTVYMLKKMYPISSVLQCQQKKNNQKTLRCIKVIFNAKVETRDT